MAFINNNRFKEIREAAKDGNEKAAMILQAMIKGNQDDVSRLVDDYYNPSEPSDPIIDESVEEETQVEEAPNEVVENTELAVQEQPEVEDISELLDNELNGIINEEEIQDLSFKDFLGNKRADGLRNKKGADYFKAYNPEGRQKYLESKTAKYRDGFNGRLKDIDRQYRDLDSSLGKYSQSVNDMLDDDIELDMDQASKAYNDITDNHDMMLGLGRAHDETDFNDVVEALHSLIAQYGKKNVMAALNTLRSDNNGYKDYRNGQINHEVERYSKNLEKLLK